MDSESYLKKLSLKRSTISGECKERCSWFNGLIINYEDDTKCFLVTPTNELICNKLGDSIIKRFSFGKLKSDDGYFDEFFDFCTNWKNKVFIKVEIDDDSYQFGDYPKEWITYAEFEKLVNECITDALDVDSMCDDHWGVSFNGYSIYIGRTIVGINDVCFKG